MVLGDREHDDRVLARVGDDLGLRPLGGARQLGSPLLSALIGGTLETGREINHGGAKYNFSGFYVTGLADTTDSLTAMKQFVYDQPIILPAELMQTTPISSA